MIQQIFASLIWGTGLVLFLSFSANAQEQPQEIVRRGKQASAFVRTSSGSGTAFCIDSAGFFITNEHLLRGGISTAKLVLNPGEEAEEVLTAKILRRDAEADLAILQVENKGEITALELGETTQLIETQRLVAFGYPFGDKLATKDGEYPNVSVNSGAVTSLRKSRGKLSVIQVDMTLNPGNSGGPVVDRSGKVVGIVQAGILGSGVNFIIPVDMLYTLLSVPLLEVDLPPFKNEAMSKLSVRPIWLQKSAEQPLQMRVHMKRRGQLPITFPMKQVNDSHELSLEIFSKSNAGTVDVRATFSDGNIIGRATDQGLKVGQKAMMLSDLVNVTRDAQSNGVTASLRNGINATGEITGLEKVKIFLGEAEFEVDLCQAKTLVISPRTQESDEVTLDFIGQVNRGGSKKDLVQRTFTINRDGTVKDNAILR